MVNLSVTTPVPGTEIWQTEQRRLTTRDYRLFDLTHAVLPTTLPLPEFYRELVKTQQVLNRKHLGFAALRDSLAIAAARLAHGQTNFVRMLWKFNSVYNAALQIADHAREVPLRAAVAARRRGGQQAFPLHPPARWPGAAVHSTIRRSGSWTPRARAVPSSSGPTVGQASVTAGPERAGPTVNPFGSGSLKPRLYV